jgi:hypothetical protein
MYDVVQYIEDSEIDNKTACDLLIRTKNWQYLVTECLQNAFEDEDVETVIKILVATKKLLHYRHEQYFNDNQFKVTINYFGGVHFDKEITQLDKELYEKGHIRFPNKGSEKKFMEYLKEIEKNNTTEE